MRKRRLALALATMAPLLTQLPSVAIAFHEGGVGFCVGCHDLHGADDPSGKLLHGADASSTCLRCHAVPEEPYNVLSDDGSSFTAGGDFYWLETSYDWLRDGRPQASPGDSHGHNTVAVEYGLVGDARLATAPGGDYPASSLSCISCHDPHGQRSGDGNAGIPIAGSGSYGETLVDGDSAGNYRLLGGRGYATSGASFENGAPVAAASLDWRETDQNHVDYGSGMSEWCANCHGAMLDGAAGKHPTGAAAVFSSQTSEAYGAYVNTGDFTGSTSVSYLALVPFERGVIDPGRLDPANTDGPEPGISNVMCLTCHRAHASAFRSMGRWDFAPTFLADSHPGPGDVGADAENGYYGRDIVAEFGIYQRSLCNKCHVRD